MSYLRFIYAFLRIVVYNAYCVVLCFCFDFLRLMLPVSLNCPLLNAPFAILLRLFSYVWVFLVYIYIYLLYLIKKVCLSFGAIE